MLCHKCVFLVHILFQLRTNFLKLSERKIVIESAYVDMLTLIIMQLCCSSDHKAAAATTSTTVAATTTIASLNWYLRYFLACSSVEDC